MNDKIMGIILSDSWNFNHSGMVHCHVVLRLSLMDNRYSRHLSWNISTVFEKNLTNLFYFKTSYSSIKSFPNL